MCLHERERFLAERVARTPSGKLVRALGEFGVAVEGLVVSRALLSEEVLKHHCVIYFF